MAPCHSAGFQKYSASEARMADEVHDSGSRVFWCNTNRGAGAEGNSLEQQMHGQRFAAAWTAVDHPDGTFNYPDHMRRVRRCKKSLVYSTPTIGSRFSGTQTFSGNVTIRPIYRNRRPWLPAHHRRATGGNLSCDEVGRGRLTPSATSAPPLRGCRRRTRAGRGA